LEHMVDTVYSLKATEITCTAFCVP
jgi:hypothetical protein